MKDIDLRAEIEYQEAIYRDRADEWFQRTKDYQKKHPNRYDAIVWAIIGIIGFFVASGIMFWAGAIAGLR